MKNESFDVIFIPGNSYHIEAMEEIASLLMKDLGIKKRLHFTTLDILNKL